MTLTEVRPLVEALTLREKMVLKAELDAAVPPESAYEIDAVRADADAAWLDELARRIDGYRDGLIKTYTREEFNDRMRVAIERARQ